MNQLHLRRGRERPLQRRHPWVLSGSVARVDGRPASGETVDLIAADGSWMARAAFSPTSRIRARVWTWNPEEPVDRDLLEGRLNAAAARRLETGLSRTTNAWREVFAESDGLPGLIVDRYASIRVVQFLSAGVERWRDEILDLLQQGEVRAIVERSEGDVRGLEGLSPRRGQIWGEVPAAEVSINEGDRRYLVDLVAGHKTGFYLDQRENRGMVEGLAAGRRVLDAFCYSGGFTISALAGGAESVVAIDSSAPALALAARNLELNGFRPQQCEWVEGDVFGVLRKFRDEDRAFDLIILDPPKFAPTSAQAERAARGYKDINLLAFKLLRGGGQLVTFSCSGGVDPLLFQKIVADAALDAGVDARIERWLAQPADHPVALTFPEGRYLKGLVCRVGS